MSAAHALKSVIEKKDSCSQAQIVDCIEYVSHALNVVVSGGYKQLVTKTPALFGALYRSTNKQNSLNGIAEHIIAKFSKRLLPLLKDFKPDAIVSTHAFAGEMMAELKKMYNLDIPLISIITDFAPHMMYLHPNITKYVVSSEKMQDELCNLGVEKERIMVLGIPIKDEFYEETDKKAELESIGLDPNLPTLLIMAGSFGVTDILKLYAEINTSETDFQIIVITGKNQKLYNAFSIFLGQNPSDEMTDFKKSINELKLKYKLGSKTAQSPKKTVLIYYTNEVNKYMHISDMIVTKPGGLTVSESLASGLPLAIFKAFPGQEEDNSQFLISNNAAVKIDKNNCRQIVDGLLNDKDKLNEMKDNCKRVSKYRSAESLYNELCQILDKI